MPPFVVARRDKYFARARVRGVQYDGPARASRTAANEDVKAIKETPPSEQAKFIASLRAEAGVGPAKQKPAKSFDGAWSDQS